MGWDAGGCTLREGRDGGLLFYGNNEADFFSDHCWVFLSFSFSKSFRKTMISGRTARTRKGTTHVTFNCVSLDTFRTGALVLAGR